MKSQKINEEERARSIAELEKRWREKNSVNASDLVKKESISEQRQSPGHYKKHIKQHISTH